jgi:hypothetical protein
MRPEDHAKLRKLIGPTDEAEAKAAAPARIVAGDVPDVLTKGLRERDGQVGRTILVYPNPASTWWRETITTFVQHPRARRAGALAKRPPQVAGGQPLSARLSP